MRKAIVFSIIVCLASWAAFAAAYWGLGLSKQSVGLNLFSVFYMFMPLLTALVLQAVHKEKFNHTGLVSFNLSWAWLVAWLLPVFMVAACIFVNGLMPGVTLEYNAEQLINQMNVPEEQQELVREQIGKMPAAMMIVMVLFSGLIAGVTVNAVAAFGEEFGWLNYLVGALRNVKFAKAALFIGVVWGIWHFPLILMGHNYPDYPQWGVPMMVAMCILLGIIELYFVLKAKSMIVAAIMHGAVNALAGTYIFFTYGGNSLLNGMAGLSGFIVMAFVILCIRLYDKHISKDNICSMTLGEALERES